jgi:hypothetical protein
MRLDLNRAEERGAKQRAYKAAALQFKIIEP